jgi:succinoglycan biosynthesis protein ExoA
MVDQVLVVIPCLNEIGHLPGLIAFFARDVPGARIVVADGGSTDGSCEAVLAAATHVPDLHLLHNPQRIQSSGINLAVARYGSDKTWLIRIDAHSEYPDGYVQGLLAAATRTGATSVVVPMITRAETAFQIAAAAAQNSVLGTGGSAHRRITAGQFIDHGHHALMRIDLFLQAGGYREDMSHNEDAELDLRLVATGGRIWLEPSLAITYFPRRTMSRLWKQYFGYGKGRATTLAIHHNRPRPRQMLPLLVPCAIFLAFASPAMPVLAMPLLIWMGLCLFAGLSIGVKSRSIPASASGVAAMVQHLAWSLGFFTGLARVLRNRPKSIELVTPSLRATSTT